MLRLTQHLLAPGGCWLAMKGSVPDDELNALEQEFRYEIHPLAVPAEAGQRHGIMLRPLA